MTAPTENRPVWDEKLALSMIGARVLIGMTYVSTNDTRLEQMFGTIISVNDHRGFEIKLEGKREGEIFWIPPHIEAFYKAPAGQYRLKATQEVVIDPDYTTTWTVNAPPQKQ